ncbi:hypothetical protein CRENBAI_006545 [Crenichthys baileyi]|uniref:Uncharacterized protein n=1 Tax=Crenichthys baileyi TaxID=28760 RepID=A0AAV9S7U9_9TELE
MKELWAHRARTGPQVAYVVSWLNEAQMKCRCAPGPSDGVSWVSIRATRSSFVSLSEAEGLWLGPIPAGARFSSWSSRLQAPRSHSSEKECPVSDSSSGGAHYPEDELDRRLTDQP